MFTRVLASIPSKICDITAEYEPLLNLSRSAKTLSEFIIETPEWIALIVNPIFAKLAELFSFRTIELSSDHLKCLEPFSRAVKYGRDFLNFFELPLAVKKLFASWNDPKVSTVKRISNLITIPQKIIESFLIIPHNFNIINLDGLGMELGKWCASKLGKSWVWQLFNFNGIFSIKEVFALGASVTNFEAYWVDYNNLQGRVDRKLDRHTVHLTPLKQTIDAVVAAEAPFGAIGPLLAQFNGQAATRHQQHQTLNHLEHAVIALHTGDDLNKFEAVSNRYIRRFFLEKDAEGLPLVIPAHLPPTVRQRLHTIMAAFPTPQVRLKRILTYKFEKSRLDYEMTKLGMKRDVVGWWYEISKMTIITLGLLHTVLNFAPLACTLASIARISTLCSVETAINFGGWCAKFFIASSGLVRTFYITYAIKPEEDKIKAAMPNPKLVFAI